MTAADLLDLDADIMADCPHSTWDGMGYCPCGADLSLTDLPDDHPYLTGK